MESYKFRVKISNANNTMHGQWYYFMLEDAIKSDPVICRDFDWSTLGMWIGKVDEKGKEIYTGDICKNGDWVEDAHAYSYREEEVIYDVPSGSYLGWNHNEDGMCCEVIGNIYDEKKEVKDGESD